MGQKINPLGFRLGTTQNHHSLWFEQPKRFSAGLQEDKKIRDCVNNFVQKNLQKSTKKSSRLEEFGIARIEIEKKIDLTRVIIYMAFQDVIEEEIKQAIPKIQTDIEKKINLVNRKLNITIKKVKEPYRQPNILAEYIAFQLQDRVSFRKAMKRAMQLAKQTNNKGIQIKLAGRLAGRDRARVRWIRKGRIPLQSVRAKIDYCSYTLRTIQGTLGIKIWIFADKELESIEVQANQ
nr:ribosomal protein S3 [Limnocharis flava]